MTTIKIDKVVSSPPDPLEANTVYAVRVGGGFDLYITDSTGTTAHTLNSSGTGTTNSIAQLRNSGQTTNLNHGTSWQNIAIDGHQDFMDDPDFTNGVNGIVCNFSGRVKVTTHIGYTVLGARVNCLVRCAVNNVGQPIEGKSGYVRNSSGHNEASATAIQYVSVNYGEEITLQTKRESSVTTNTLGDNGKCMILLERI